MGSFSKVTNFLRDVLLSENPQARPKEEVAELLHDDIPGMEVNHQDEPGFEVITKVMQRFVACFSQHTSTSVPIIVVCVRREWG